MDGGTVGAEGADAAGLDCEGRSRKREVSKITRTLDLRGGRDREAAKKEGIDFPKYSVVSMKEMSAWSLLGLRKLELNYRQGAEFDQFEWRENSPNKNSLKKQEMREFQKINRVDITTMSDYLPQRGVFLCVCMCTSESEHKRWMWNYSCSESPTFCRRDQVTVCFIVIIIIAILYIIDLNDLSKLTERFHFILQPAKVQFILYFCLII